MRHFYLSSRYKRWRFESAPEQLRKCFGAVTKVFRCSFKSSGKSYKSSGAVITLPDQLGYADVLPTMTLTRFHNIPWYTSGAKETGIFVTAYWIARNAPYNLLDEKSWLIPLVMEWNTICLIFTIIILYEKLVVLGWSYDYQLSHGFLNAHHLCVPGKHSVMVVSIDMVSFDTLPHLQ